MCVNISTQQIFNTTVKISATIVEEKALVFIQKHFNTEEIKYVSIVEYIVRETLYGMPEQEFISNATILPPRAKVD